MAHLVVSNDMLKLLNDLSDTKKVASTEKTSDSLAKYTDALGAFAKIDGPEKITTENAARHVMMLLDPSVQPSDAVFENADYASAVINNVCAIKKNNLNLDQDVLHMSDSILVRRLKYKDNPAIVANFDRIQATIVELGFGENATEIQQTVSGAAVTATIKPPSFN